MCYVTIVGYYLSNNIDGIRCELFPNYNAQAGQVFMRIDYAVLLQDCREYSYYSVVSWQFM